MNYYAELMKKAEELGLRIIQSRYDDHLLRASVRYIVIHEPRGAGNIITQLKLVGDFWFEKSNEQEVYKAHRAIMDYASWK